MEDSVPQSNSLVKYSTPVLVSVAGKQSSSIVCFIVVDKKDGQTPTKKLGKGM